MTNVLRVFFLFFAFSMASCTSDKPEDVAYKFLNEYYSTKDIRNVKKYMHDSLIKTIYSEDGRTREMWRSTNQMIASWSNVSFKEIQKEGKGESLMMKFRLKGIFSGKELETNIHVTLKLQGDHWRVVAFG